MQTRRMTQPEKPTKPNRKPKLGRKDLRTPAKPIHCLRCSQDKPPDGAARFHSFWVCRDCAQKLNSMET